MDYTRLFISVSTVTPVTCMNVMVSYKGVYPEVIWHVACVRPHAAPTQSGPEVFGQRHNFCSFVSRVEQAFLRNKQAGPGGGCSKGPNKA